MEGLSAVGASQPGTADRIKRLRGFSLPRASGVLIAIVVVMIVFAVMNQYFLTVQNLLGMLRAMSSLAIMALGEMLVIVVGEIDLSVGSSYGLGAMALGVLWMHGIPFYLSLVLGLGVGALAGLMTAFFTTYVRIPSFVVTLGMLNLEQGITLLISGSQSISPSYSLPPGHGSELAFFNGLAGAQLPLGIPAQVVWMAVAAIVVGLVFNRFLFGFRLKAIGGNPEAAKLQRLPIRRYKFWVFAVSGLLAALAGILDFSFIGTTDPTSGASLTFPVFAAVIIGGASLSGGRGSVLGTLIGALLLAVLQNGLALLDVGAYAQLVFVGLVTIGAVAVDQWGALRQWGTRST